MSFRCSFRSSAVMSGIGLAPPGVRDRSDERADVASPPAATGARGISTLMSACSVPRSHTFGDAARDTLRHPPVSEVTSRAYQPLLAIPQERRDINFLVGDLDRR